MSGVASPENPTRSAAAFSSACVHPLVDCHMAHRHTGTVALIAVAEPGVICEAVASAVSTVPSCPRMARSPAPAPVPDHSGASIRTPLTNSVAVQA
jgi:hypothetical protein